VIGARRGPAVTTPKHDAATSAARRDAGLAAVVRGLVDGLADLIFPKRCVVCGAPGAWLCAGCTPALAPVAVACRRCAASTTRPLDGCRECRGRALAFEAARAAFVYEGPARRLVTACKFRPLRSLADEMAGLARDAFLVYVGAGGDAAGADVVTSVPVHRERRLERGFDQGELLARGLAAAAGLPYAGLLRRHEPTQRQSSLDRRARAANVSGAFALDERRCGKAGKVKKIVLIDDVYTTGETLNQCALELRSAGLVPYAFAFARSTRRSC
jgi:ComF family protein